MNSKQKRHLDRKNQQQTRKEVVLMSSDDRLGTKETRYVVFEMPPAVKLPCFPVTATIEQTCRRANIVAEDVSRHFSGLAAPGQAVSVMRHVCDMAAANPAMVFYCVLGRENMVGMSKYLTQLHKTALRNRKQKVDETSYLIAYLWMNDCYSAIDSTVADTETCADEINAAFRLRDALCEACDEIPDPTPAVEDGHVDVHRMRRFLFPQ